MIEGMGFGLGVIFGMICGASLFVIGVAVAALYLGWAESRQRRKA